MTGKPNFVGYYVPKDHGCSVPDFDLKPVFHAWLKPGRCYLKGHKKPKAKEQLPREENIWLDKIKDEFI